MVQLYGPDLSKDHGSLSLLWDEVPQNSLENMLSRSQSLHTLHYHSHSIHPMQLMTRVNSSDKREKCIRYQEDFLLVIFDFCSWLQKKSFQVPKRNNFYIFFSPLSHLVKCIFFFFFSNKANIPFLTDSDLSCTCIWLFETNQVILNFILSGILKHEFLAICSTVRTNKLWNREKIRNLSQLSFTNTQPHPSVQGLPMAGFCSE